MYTFRRQPSDGEQRASTAELFLDLVFVLIVTQLSAFLVANLTLAGAAQMAFLLCAAWWAWLYTTWMTNWAGPDTSFVRVVALVVVLFSMLGAISVPQAFGDRAPLLVAGYVGVQFVRNTFFAAAWDRRDPLYRPILRIWIWSFWVAPLWVAGVFLEGWPRAAVWGTALAFDYLGPLLGHWTPGLGRTRPREWDLEHAHFNERVGLFMIIALGESIVVTGAIASSLDFTLFRLLGVGVAVLMTAALWWLYFDYHARRVGEQLARAGEDRARLARDLGYLHVPLIGGIIATAVANELVIAHPGDALSTRELLVLAAGPMLYLLGSVAFKLRSIDVVATQRLGAVVVVALVAWLGTVLPALATWTLVLSVLVALAALETQERFREAAEVET